MGFRLRAGQPAFTVMAEGPWENKAYRPGELYRDIPPGYEDRFEDPGARTQEPGTTTQGSGTRSRVSGARTQEPVSCNLNPVTYTAGGDV